MKGAGARVWGLGIVALGLVGLAFGDFEGGQEAPAQLPYRALLALAANIFLVAAGACVQWRQTRSLAAGALVAYWLIVVTALMAGRVVLAHPKVFGAYSGLAEVAAVGTAGLIVWAESRTKGGDRVALVRGAQVGFGVCAILFGIAHFAYMNLTAPLVPRWLPPSGVFWGYATGVAQILAGVAIATGLMGRLAAVLLTIMYVSFTLLVHLPLLMGAPSKVFFWSENALNLTLIGVAWVVAQSFGRTRTAAYRMGVPPVTG